MSNYTSGKVHSYDANSGASTGPFLGSTPSPSGMALATNGNLLVVNSNSNQIRAYDGHCGSDLGVFASGGGLNQPRDLVIGPSGNLFVANRGGNNVLQFDDSTGAFLGVFASANLSAPIGLAFAPSGNLFVTSLNTDRVVEFDGGTGALVQVLPTGPELDGPVALLFRPNGNLLVSSSFTDQVLEYTANTWAFAGVFAGGIELDNPIGLLWDAAGDLLVSSSQTGQVLRYSGTTGSFLGVFATPGGDPWDLIEGPSAGSLPVVPGYTVSEFVTDIPRPFTLGFSPTGVLFAGQQTQPATGVEAFVYRIDNGGNASAYGNAPTLDPDVVVYDQVGVVSGAPGSVITGGEFDSSRGAIYRIAPDQSVATLVAPTTILRNPYKMLFDGQGRLLCTDNQRASLFVIGPGTATPLMALASPASGLAIDSTNRIYTSYQNGNVALHSSNGSLLNSSHTTGLGPAAPLAIGPGGPGWGTSLYSINTTTGELVRIASNGTQTVLGAGFANDQSDLAFGIDGHLYVSQVCTGRIVRLAFDASYAGAPYCFGDGSGGLCPCGANGNPGQGCANSGGVGGALLTGTGAASLSNDTFQLHVSGAPGNKPGLILRGANAVNGGLGNPVADGLLCTSGNTARSQVQVTLAGNTTFLHFQGGSFGTSSYGLGAPTNYQFWYRDPSNPCSGTGFNFSNAWRASWLP